MIGAHEVEVWAASGAMALTGGPDTGPLGPPALMVPKLEAIAAVLEDRAVALGGHIQVDPVALLGERATIAGLRPGGQVSCGGATRLLRAGADWLAVSLPRTDDIDLVPAWLEIDGPVPDPWAAVAEAIATRPVSALVDRAVLLGLPVGLLPRDREPPGQAATDEPLPLRRVLELGPPTPPLHVGELVVVGLGSLWAGPLCTSLLAAAGATVVKVESTRRPDGARQGPAAFFDLLNGHTRSVALDLATTAGVRALHDVLAHADVVVEASRPRALHQLGVDAEHLLETAAPRVWVSITGHGRDGPASDRVAFGDDAAVAGGLVCWHDDQPHFCADAVADPATGLVAAAAALDALAAGGHWLLDVSMAGVAAHLAGPTRPVPTGVTPAPPRARPALGPAPALGEHTAAVLASLGSLR